MSLSRHQTIDRGRVQSWLRVTHFLLVHLDWELSYGYRPISQSSFNQLPLLLVQYLQHFVVLQCMFRGGHLMPRKVTGHISEYELARMLGMTVWGLRAWRRRNYGPPAKKFGKSVFYTEKAVAQFLGSEGA